MSGFDFDLPYERNPEPVTLDLSNALLSGGVVVMAATIPAPGTTTPLPSLVFRFAKPDGTGFYPPVLLVVSDEHMAQLRPLILRAVHDAREAAKAAGGAS